MLRLWNHKTKTVTVTRNLVLELKYDTVNKKLKTLITTCPVGQASEMPDRVSYLPRAVGQSLLSYPADCSSAATETFPVRFQLIGDFYENIFPCCISRRHAAIQTFSRTVAAMSKVSSPTFASRFPPSITSGSGPCMGGKAKSYTVPPSPFLSSSCTAV